MAMAVPTIRSGSYSRVDT